MAASTITRSTLTDNVTTWDAATVNSAVYDKVDQLLSGAGSYTTLTLGGLLAAEGLGTHSLSAGGSGGNILLVRNTTAGTGNSAEMRLGNDNDADIGRLIALSSTYTSSNQYRASGVTLESGGSGGLNLSGTTAGGVSVYVNASKLAVVGTAASLNVTGDSATAIDATVYGRAIQTTRATAAGQHLAMVRTGSKVWSIGYAYNTTTFAIGDGQATDSSFTAAAASLTITAAGEVQGPLQPGFLARNTSSDTSVANNDTIDFDTEVYDTGSDFSGDTFTAPVTGKYLLTAVVAVTNTSGGADTPFLGLETGNAIYYGPSAPSLANSATARLCVSVVADMDASDTAIVKYYGSGATIVGSNAGSPVILETYFSGRLLV